MQEHDSEQTETPDDTDGTVEQTDDVATAEAEGGADETTAEAGADETTAEGGADETTAEAGADETVSADAVEQQAAASDGTVAESAPEVPDDASATIARAQAHIDGLDMKEEAKDAQAATSTSDGMAGP